MTPISDSPTRRTALVTGGSGFVGGHLIARLLKTGWQVRGIGRSGSSRSAVAALGAEPREADLANADALERAMEGVDTVFHVAAHFKLWGPLRVFRAMNVDGTRNVVTAAERAGVRRVVYVSAAAVVMGHPQPQHRVTEDLPLQRMGFAPYSASKADAEELLRAASGRRKGFSTVAIRPPMIWGPDMPMLDHMVETVKAGQFRWVAGGGQTMSTCHVDNLCHALILAADQGKDGAAYFVSDSVDTTLKSFLSRLLATRGVQPDDRGVPFRFAWTIAGIMGAVWRLLRLKGEPPLTRQMLRLMGKDFTVDISRARKDLGYGPVLSPEDGLRLMAQPAFHVRDSTSATGSHHDALNARAEA
ncbi:MAG: NAD-dependent epimerase/dehydratase family protein [Pararhodobacter sp.]|nr:NAD-dependent epimerase/dehydratase family protein [Pararhodobacter sp.]